MHVVRISINATLLVQHGHQRVGVPVLPQPADGLDRLIGIVVTSLARRQLIQTEILCLQMTVPGDYVPGDAPAANQVMGAEGAGDMIWRIER